MRISDSFVDFETGGKLRHSILQKFNARFGFYVVKNFGCDPEMELGTRTPRNNAALKQWLKLPQSGRIMGDTRRFEYPVIR